jgi:predicted MPP superfamily phosphohydrolase
LVLIWLGVLAALSAFFIWQDNDIVVSEIDCADSKVPRAFDGYRILHVSDLHGKRFGRAQRRLLRLAAACRPDIIAVTGDVIDGRRKKTAAALSFVSQATGIAPVYYVAGNHEWRYGRYDALREQLRAAGAAVLDNAGVTLKKENGRIRLLGVKDLAFGKVSVFKKNLRKLAGEASGMTILLSHHPEKIALYAACGFDLVLSGHAHGGQVRLPGIGGLFAPGQGVFPKYTSGLHKVEGTSMVISRGLGNSLFPLRVFNRPELVLVTLRAV